MERKLPEMDYRVESGLVSDTTHTPGNGELGRTVRAELAKGSEALQAACKKAAAAVGSGIQVTKDDVITYARREPGAALAAAAGFGLLIGLAISMGSRSNAGRRGAWLPQLNSKRTSMFGKRTGSGWRGWGK
ncbi:MAG TPA: hypothetical protein VIF59_10095 [Methylomirabilota bacterium]